MPGLAWPGRWEWWLSASVPRTKTSTLRISGPSAETPGVRPNICAQTKWDGSAVPNSLGLLRQRWTDPRLVFEGNKSFTLDARLVEFLWVPDTYIVESKTSFLHKVTVGNRLIRLFSNGTVLYALRYRGTCRLRVGGDRSS